MPDIIHKKHYPALVICKKKGEEIRLRGCFMVIAENRNQNRKPKGIQMKLAASGLRLNVLHGSWPVAPILKAQKKVC